jgi:hypothetical protein
MSSTATRTATASASPTASAGALSTPSSLKIVGILLAIISGVLIGTSFVFKKKGLLKSQADGVAGEGVAYLKSVCRLNSWIAGSPLTFFPIVVSVVDRDDLCAVASGLQASSESYFF